METSRIRLVTLIIFLLFIPSSAADVLFGAGVVFNLQPVLIMGVKLFIYWTVIATLFTIILGMIVNIITEDKGLISISSNVRNYEWLILNDMLSIFSTTDLIIVGIFFFIPFHYFDPSVNGLAYSGSLLYSSVMGFLLAFSLMFSIFFRYFLLNFVGQDYSDIRGSKVGIASLAILAGYDMTRHPKFISIYLTKALSYFKSVLRSKRIDIPQLPDVQWTLMMMIRNQNYNSPANRQSAIDLANALAILPRLDHLPQAFQEFVNENPWARFYEPAKYSGVWALILRFYKFIVAIGAVGALVGIFGKTLSEIVTNIISEIETAKLPSASSVTLLEIVLLSAIVFFLIGFFGMFRPLFTTTVGVPLLLDYGRSLNTSGDQDATGGVRLSDTPT